MFCSLARWLYSLPAGALRVRAHAYFLLLFAPCLSPLGMFVAGKAGWESLCPLGKILTYNNLIYLLNFPFYCVNGSYLVDRCRITTHWMEGSKSQQGFLSELWASGPWARDSSHTLNHSWFPPPFLSPEPPGLGL